MAVPTWSVGQVLTASDVNTWFVPRAVRKPGDQGVGNTTLVDDSALQLAVDASAEYEFEFRLICTGAAITTGDIKVTVEWPSGGVARWTGFGFALAGGSPGPAVTHVEDTSGNVHSFGVDGAGLSPVLIKGDILTSSTSGTLKLRWAQNSSSGTQTKVLAGSKLVMRRTG